MMPVVVAVNSEKLKRLRLSKGWTQSQLADAAGVSTDTVVRWENARPKTPRPSALVKLAEALGVQPGDLLD